jgi:hypothetical protein
MVCVEIPLTTLVVYQDAMKPWQELAGKEQHHTSTKPKCPELHD